MTKNNILNFIVQSIQWGEKLEGEDFYSEKELIIKFNCSQTTAKNALNIAEAMGLLISSKGKKRKVTDFSKNVYMSKYLNLKDVNLIVERYDKQNSKSKNIFKEYFKHPLKNIMIVNLKNNNEWIGSLYSSTPLKELFNFFFQDSISFLSCLKNSNLLIDKIFKKTVITKEGNVLIKRKMYDSNKMLIEEAVLIINPKYFLRETKTNYNIC